MHNTKRLISTVRRNNCNHFNSEDAIRALTKTINKTKKVIRRYEKTKQNNSSGFLPAMRKVFGFNSDSDGESDWSELSDAEDD